MVVGVIDPLPLLSEDQALCAPRPTLSVNVTFLVVAAVEPWKLPLVVAEAVAADRLARRIRLKRSALPAERVAAPSTGTNRPRSVTISSPRSIARNTLPMVWSSRFPVAPRTTGFPQRFDAQKRAAFSRSFVSCSSTRTTLAKRPFTESQSPTTASGSRPVLRRNASAAPSQHTTRLAAERTFHALPPLRGKSPAANITTFDTSLTFWTGRRRRRAGRTPA